MVRDAGKILIVGGGPAGLGAAWRLREVGYPDWELLEKESCVGGLAASHLDASGFTWDLGGHVVFSHYDYFDALLDSLLEQQWVRHEREAWVWMRDRFIPYPLQNNIRHLPTPELLECLEGLLDAQAGRRGRKTEDGRRRTARPAVLCPLSSVLRRLPIGFCAVSGPVWPVSF